MRPYRVLRWAALSALTLSVAPALAEPVTPDQAAEAPTTAQLQEQIRQLQAKVEQLQSAQSSTNAQVVDQTVERVLRDADNRSRLLQADSSLTAGFKNDKFFIASEDGNWSFMPGFLLQVRNTTNWNTSGDDDIENGFEIRRAKLIFAGTAVTKNLSYYFQWNTSQNNGGVSLDDAYVRYKMQNDIQWKAGQYKDPWYKEENTSDAKQLAAERSLQNSLIGGGVTGRVQGVSVIHENDKYRGEVMYHDGYNTANTNWQDGNGGSDYIAGGTNFGMAARFDWFFTGKGSKEVEDFTALNNKENLFVVGAGLDYTQGGDNQVLFQTIDVQWENTKGLGLYGSLVGAWRDIGSPAAGEPPPAGDYYDWGFLVQGGYLINDRCEIFVRYDLTFLDDAALPAGTNDTVNEIAVGTNYYFHKHNVKFTLDFTYLPDGSPINATGLGIVEGDSDQFVIRAQLQLYL